jgi:hypothetical protein
VSADITVNIIAAPLDHFAPSNSTPAPA